MRRFLITGTCSFFRNCYVGQGLYLGGLKLFEKNPLGKCTMYIVIELIPKRFYPAFSFSSVLIQRH